MNFKTCYDFLGNIHKATCPYTSPKNSIVVTRDCHILVLVHTLLFAMFITH